MNPMNIRHLSSAILIASSVLVLSACQSLDFDVGDRIDYKNNKSINALEVPPDLSAPDYDPTYSAMPGGSVSASALARGEARHNSRAVLPVNAGIQLMSNGNVRWLQVNAPADAVWPKLQEFWRVMGVDIKRDEPRVGIMETDWAENKAEIPLDFIRKALGKAFEGMYDAGSRDRFKIRLERPSAGATNVYLSHERAEEHVSGTGTKWEYKPSKPELEGEMLNRLMIFMQGGDASRNAAPIPEASLTSVPVAMTQLEGGYPALMVGGGANDVWVRTGVMLGRIGLSIEDQQRGKGVYVATYQGDTDRGEKQGFFTRMFKSDRDVMKIGSHYQVMIADAGNRSVITIGDVDGTPLKAGAAQSILERLKSEFER
ncbi:MAG: outer membrane protein assembly factor BamC [Thiothrix sp.]|uniref:outer membrane protein assembly factor BamC n=1 Tax=Thiothrix sp. TaxID=1032 RepID=UPI002634B13F|nr:outer membrane protein assembly factor BamC [Thiothrix sp.]MDD5394755.1 outer membrane protein assembly factor BamC [Thiothrix sp.]